MSALRIGAQVLALTVFLFICYAIAGAMVRLETPPQTPEQAGQTMLALLAVCFLNSIVLTHLTLRSDWSGWRLMAAVFVVFYGVTTFMGQIESAVFVTRLPAGTLPRLFLMGILVVAPYSVLSVLILGRGRGSAAVREPGSRLVMPAGEWAWKLGLIAVVYVTLYFTFGYFIAWQNPEVREYYAGPNEGSFPAHMEWVVRTMPWLIPFQFLRAMLWAALALPVIRMLKGSWRETALSLGLLFGVVMNAQLLLPNPYMPEGVRMTHLLETATSNFIFGCFVGWLLTQRFAFRRMEVAPS